MNSRRRLWRLWRYQYPGDCPAKHNNNDFHTHGCTDHVNHEAQNHICECGLLWEAR